MQFTRPLLYAVGLSFLAYWVVLVVSPSPNVAGVENNVVYFIQRILDGQAIYTDPAQSPFSIAQYTPLYYEVVAAVAKPMFEADDVRSLFIVNRIVSLTLLLACCAVVGIISRRLFGRSKSQSADIAIFAFIFLEISSFARPDSLSLLCYLLSFYFFLWSVQQPSTLRYLGASALLAILAVFSKQSALILPVSCLAWLMLMRMYRQAWTYSLTGLTASAAAILLISFTCGLRPFFLNTVLGIDNGIRFDVFIQYIVGEFLTARGIVWLIVMPSVVYLLLRKGEPVHRFIAILIVVQFVFSLLTSLKYGSSSNYYTEWWMLVIIGAVACFDEITDVLGKRISLSLPAALLIFRVAVIAYPLYHKLSQPEVRLFQAEQTLVDKINALEEKDDYRVFYNVFSPDHYFNNIDFRHAVVPQNDVVTLGTWPRQVFDYTGLLQAQESGQIKWMVTEKALHPKGFLPLVPERYALVDSFAGYRLFKYSPIGSNR